MKLLGELKQYFLHIKLRVLLFSILPFIQHSSPKLYLKKTVPLQLGSNTQCPQLIWQVLTNYNEHKPQLCSGAYL